MPGIVLADSWTKLWHNDSRCSGFHQRADHNQYGKRWHSGGPIALRASAHHGEQRHGADHHAAGTTVVRNRHAYHGSRPFVSSEHRLCQLHACRTGVEPERWGFQHQRQPDARTSGRRRSRLHGGRGCVRPRLWQYARLQPLGPANEPTRGHHWQQRDDTNLAVFVLPVTLFSTTPVVRLATWRCDRSSIVVGIRYCTRR